jgi:hypothetical protein
LAEEVAANAATLQCIAAVEAPETEVRLIETAAMRRVSAPAMTAVTARLVREQDMIAPLDSLHASTHLLYHSCTFMTQHYCVVRRIPVVAEVDIGTADARGDKAHQDFVVPWPFHLKGFYLQGAAFLAQNGCLYLVCFHVRVRIHFTVPLSLRKCEKIELMNPPVLPGQRLMKQILSHLLIH